MRHGRSAKASGHQAVGGDRQETEKVCELATINEDMMRNFFVNLLCLFIIVLLFPAIFVVSVVDILTPYEDSNEVR